MIENWHMSQGEISIANGKKGKGNWKNEKKKEIQNKKGGKKKEKKTTKREEKKTKKKKNEEEKEVNRNFTEESWGNHLVIIEKTYKKFVRINEEGQTGQTVNRKEKTSLFKEKGRTKLWTFEDGIIK